MKQNVKAIESEGFATFGPLGNIFIAVIGAVLGSMFINTFSDASYGFWGIFARVAISASVLVFAANLVRVVGVKRF